MRRFRLCTLKRRIRLSRDLSRCAPTTLHLRDGYQISHLSVGVLLPRRELRYTQGLPIHDSANCYSSFFFWPPASPDGHRPTKSGRPSRTDLTSTPSAATHPRRQKHPTGGASAGSGHNPALRGPQSPGINFCATHPAIFPPKGSVDYYGKMRHGNADTSWERTAPADHCTSYRKPTWSVLETQAHCRP